MLTDQESLELNCRTKYGNFLAILNVIIALLVAVASYFIYELCTDKKLRENFSCRTKKKKIAKNSNTNHKHKGNHTSSARLFDPDKNSYLEELSPSDSDNDEIWMESDSEENDATSELEQKPSPKAKNVIAPRKNRKGGFNVHKSNSTRPAPAFASPTLPPRPRNIASTTVITLSMDGVAPIKKKGEIIGDMTVNPKLVKKLTIEGQQVLFDLWKSGEVIVSDSKGEDGYIFRKKKAKHPELRVKAKKHDEDFRFFAVHRPDGRSNQFCLTAYQPKHGLPIKMISF